MRYRYGFIGFMLLAGNAQAASLYTTPYLQSLCNSTYDVEAGLCSGYIMGIADSLQAQGKACLSPAIGPETLTINIRRGWEQAPEQPADALQSVSQLIESRFPCR